MERMEWRRIWHLVVDGRGGRAREALTFCAVVKHYLCSTWLLNSGTSLGSLQQIVGVGAFGISISLAS